MGRRGGGAPKLRSWRRKSLEGLRFELEIKSEFS
jgi:hypothetical protein